MKVYRIDTPRPVERSGATGASTTQLKFATPSGDGPQDQFAVKLGAMGRLWRSHCERVLKTVGLSLIQWQALHYLSRQADPVVQRHLAFAIGVEEPALVGVLDRLEASRLVQRKAALHDRRAKTVHLTPLAAGALDRAEVALREMRESLLAGIAPVELERAACLFDVITERLWEAGRQKDSSS